MSGLNGDEKPGSRQEPRLALRALASEHEVVIRHAGQRDRLRITANDTLILTK
ncbi:MULTISPECIES: hemin uptake protein HemP [unclassified Methylobacterium]|uniref:hemin uptake protein HemP n=1 Tax=unclassified Methylobacterium TaxID=2615210 RepID=UPI001FBAF06D|nr:MULTISPECIES: hemin uptake protein HemP [unclassified Methylobacterium]MCJ2093912.1 hemin uptake protein HemP [Methylobacterium sp. J-072]MCJ2139792.1 hemin uptake protein HemP [Methylobacterium sp. E-066]